MKAMQRLWTEKAGANAQATPGSPQGLLSTAGRALEGLEQPSTDRARPCRVQCKLTEFYFVSSEHLLWSGMLGPGDTVPVLNIKAKCG